MHRGWPIVSTPSSLCKPNMRSHFSSSLFSSFLNNPWYQLVAQQRPTFWRPVLKVFGIGIRSNRNGWWSIVSWHNLWHWFVFAVTLALTRWIGGLPPCIRMRKRYNRQPWMHPIDKDMSPRNKKPWCTFIDFLCFHYVCSFFRFTPIVIIYNHPRLEVNLR